MWDFVLSVPQGTPQFVATSADVACLCDVAGSVASSGGRRRRLRRIGRQEIYFLNFLRNPLLATGCGSFLCFVARLPRRFALQGAKKIVSVRGMATLVDLRTELAQIEAILNAGAKSVSVDGITTTIDLDRLATRRREIQRQLTPGKRPRVATINLRNA